MAERAAAPPLCLARHIPLKGGDRPAALSSLHLRRPRWPGAHHESISLLVGEMAGRPEGGKPHPQVSRYAPQTTHAENTSQPNQSLTRFPSKQSKKPTNLSQWPANRPHTAPVPPSDTPQGVAARRDRRWGWEGDANLSTSGSGSDLPGGTGERRRRFRTGCRCLSNVRTGPACLCCKTPFRVLRLGHGGPVRPPPGVPTAHRPLVERDHGD
jgi:hypothetical protein